MHIRATEMAQVCEKSRKKYLESKVGKTLTVLFEKESSPQWYQGHSPEYVLVKVKRDNVENSLRRCVRNVKITHSDSECCYGEFENDEKC